MNFWSDVMSFFNNPIVMCSAIALGIILILVVVVVICCKKSSDRERDELKALSEEIETNNFEETNSSSFDDDKLEGVLSKMQEALDMKEETSISFEQEQEENAIISYQELLNSLGAKSSIDVDSIEVYDDELESNIEISDFNKEIIESYQKENLDREIYRFQNDYSSQEMPMEFSSIDKPVMDFQSVNAIQEDDTSNEEVYVARHVEGRFKKSEIISPVYGIMNSNNVVTKVDDVEEIIFDDV